MLKISILFLSIGLVLVLYGFTWSWQGILLIWLCVSFIITSVSYFLNAAWIFGKSSRGDRTWWANLLLMPYLKLTWLMWWFFRHSDSNPCCHQITEKIWLGRRPIVAELPDKINLVIDLTCEFTPQPAIKKYYLSLPILDHGIPQFNEFDSFIQQLVSFPGHVYIHCAAGRSRSAMTVAAILLKQGLYQVPQEAIDHVKVCRSCIELTTDQEWFLTEWYDRSIDHRLDF